MADHTPQQKQRLVKLRETYGPKTVKAYARSKVNGRMRVEATCQLGTWTWIFDEAGDLVIAYMEHTLFDMDPVPPKPTNAIHN